MKPVYYIDMDGVIAVWNQNASEEETHENGYFLNRDVELSAIAFVRMLKDSGADVRILSSVYMDDHSSEDKSMWLVQNGLGDLPKTFVPYGHDKHAYINDENGFPVLIDDYSKNLIAWEEEGYLAFKFFNGVNNMPRLKVKDGTIQISTDTWTGYSIDRRMSPAQMYLLVTSVTQSVIKTKEEAVA